MDCLRCFSVVLGIVAACSPSPKSSVGSHPGPAHENDSEPAVAPRAEDAAAQPTPSAAVTPFAEATTVVASAPTRAELKTFAHASNAFAFDLYEKVRSKSGNLAFSPASITLALGMTWAGARGDTASEIQHVLHIAAASASYHEAAGRILAAWNDPEKKSYQLAVVNRLFGDAHFAFEPPFLKQMSEQYGAPLEKVDFRGAPSAQRARINAWVKGQTGGRIDELLPDESIDDLTRMVLVDAVYFRGQWKSAFPEYRTRPARFHLAGGKTKQVSMMARTLTAGTAIVGGVKVLELPYRGDDLAMVIALPARANGLPALEQRLSPQLFTRWVRGLQPRKVDVSLPRFTIRHARLDLTAILKAMGIKTAFSDAADFTAMADPPAASDRLQLSSVFHEAFVKVDEQGTEAAAATAVQMRALGAMPEHNLVFKADHPFLFAIRDRRSGTILFLGRVTDPA